MNKKSKKQKEWYLDLPWGKLAMISWGDSSRSPVLLLHGYMDNAGTYVPLLHHLPDTHYYVAFDMPGHGKSDPFPLGPLLNQGHIVEVINMVVQRLGWKTFLFIGHSMGYTVGAMYNRVYPRRMSRLIALDPEPPISNYFYSDYPHVVYNFSYPTYYSELDNPAIDGKKYYTREETLKHVMKKRGLTVAQAQPIVERALVPMGNGVYKLSFELNARLISMVPLSFSSFLSVVSTHPVPTLILHSSKSIMAPLTRDATKMFMEEMRKSLKYLEEETIEAGHDLHLTNAEECGRKIEMFLKKDFGNKKCKL